MPTYEYDCTLCGLRYNKSRSMMEDDPGYQCEICNKELVRVYSNVGIQFNGKGFYTTDYGKK
jgi:putative FmdB family regulatory protein